MLRFLGSANSLVVDLDIAVSGVAVRRTVGVLGPAGDVPPIRQSKDRRWTEDIAIVTPSPVHNGAPAVVMLSTFLGAQERVVVQLDRSRSLSTVRRAGDRLAAQAGMKVYLDFTAALPPQSGGLIPPRHGALTHPGSGCFRRGDPDPVLLPLGIVVRNSFYIDDPMG